MAKIKIRQESIAGGLSPTFFPDWKKGEYAAAIGIDPDITYTTPGGPTHRTSANINPTGYQMFNNSSSDTFESHPIWIGSPPGQSLVLVVLANGRIKSYSDPLTSASETTVGTVAGNLAKGAFVQNDYLYIITGTDMSRYGPLSGSASLTNNVWTGATLGSQTALTNTTYPSVQGPELPNHWAVQHIDGQAYVLDYASGAGIVHAVRTTTAGANDGSAYNVLDLPPGFKPTSIESWGNDIAILAVQTTNADLRQGNAALFMWDTFSPSFYAQIPLSDVYGTALKNNNGVLHVFSGNNTSSRVSIYTGGNQLKDILFFESGATPFPGAVAVYGDRLFFGNKANISGDNFYAVVDSYGSKNVELPNKLHVPVVIPRQPQYNPYCTAVGIVQQLSGELPRLVAGFVSSAVGTNPYGVVKLGFDMVTNPAIIVFRYYIGQRFKVSRVAINTNITTSASRTFSVNVLTDGTDTSAMTVTNGKQSFNWKRPSLNIRGNKYVDIYVEFTGTSAVSINLPLEVDIETFGDQPISLEASE